MPPAVLPGLVGMPHSPPSRRRRHVAVTPASFRSLPSGLARWTDNDSSAPE